MVHGYIHGHGQLAHAHRDRVSRGCGLEHAPQERLEAAHQLRRAVAGEGFEHDPVDGALGIVGCEQFVDLTSRGGRLGEEVVEFGDDGALMKPRSAMSIPVTPGVEVKENLVAEITYSMTKIPYEYTPPTPPLGPAPR